MTSSNSGFVCLPCGIPLRNMICTKSHFNSKHVELDVIFVCPACKKPYSVKRNLYAHIRTYHREFLGIKIDKCAVKKSEMNQ